jgi:hypothetical protein
MAGGTKIVKSQIFCPSDETKLALIKRSRSGPISYGQTILQGLTTEDNKIPLECEKDLKNRHQLAVQLAATLIEIRGLCNGQQHATPISLTGQDPKKNPESKRVYRFAQQALGLSPYLSLVLRLSAATQRQARLHARLDTANSYFALYTRDNRASEWSQAGRTSSLTGYDVLRVACAPKSLISMELRVVLMACNGQDGGRFAEQACAVVSLERAVRVALAAGSDTGLSKILLPVAINQAPEGLRLRGFATKSWSAKKPSAGVGSVVVCCALDMLAIGRGLQNIPVGACDENAAVQSRNYRTLTAPPFDRARGESLWGVELLISHSAWTTCDAKNTIVVVSRVDTRWGRSMEVGRSKPLLAQARRASGAGPAPAGALFAPIRVSGELARFGLLPDEKGLGAALLVEWRRPRRGGAGKDPPNLEAVVCSMRFELCDLRVLHTGDILGPFVWHDEGCAGVTNRLVLVQDSSHSPDLSRLELRLTL